MKPDSDFLSLHLGQYPDLCSFHFQFYVTATCFVYVNTFDR